MTTIGLVQCSAKKLATKCAARELYSASALFTKSLAYAERRCHKVYVVSAVYDLVELDQVIAPYNRQLTTKESHAWGQRVAGHLIERHGREAYYLVLAGADYAGPLYRALTTYDGWFSDGWHGVDKRLILRPLHGMPIGERLRYLNENRDAR